MSTAFSRTLRSLQADGFRLSLAGILVAAVLIGAWTAWAVLARLTLYEVTDAARIEVDQAAHPIQSPLLGRIVKTNLAIGREVLAGDVLIELDAQPQRLQIREEQTLLSTLPSQIEALRAQRAAEEQSRRNEQQTARAAQEEARAGVRKAEAPERLAEVEQQRLKDLRAEGLIAERDFQRGAAEVQERKADVESQQLTIPRLQREQQTRESDREALVRQIDAQVQALDTQLATAQAEVGRLQYEVERRTIRAPIAGRIAEAAVLRAGSVVDEGDRLGAIVPSGKLRVIAQFPPPAALGRIRPGQTARVRLQGFPWTQYGSVAASVTEVASEVRDGTVRVDMAVVSQPPAIPLQHGLPGSVEVEVERISPARLVLRHAGRLLTQPRSAFAAENTSRGVN